MAQIRLTILVHETWLDRYLDVVERCRQAGMKVEKELATLGAITGCIEQDRLATLTDVEGVSAVEPQRTSRTLT